jgi:hypothetical protein
MDRLRYLGFDDGHIRKSRRLIDPGTRRRQAPAEAVGLVPSLREVLDIDHLRRGEEDFDAMAGRIAEIRI